MNAITFKIYRASQKRGLFIYIIITMMEMILLIGIPASGKSSFYKTYLFNKYMRISLDLYNTRNKERCFLDVALQLQQRVAIDNTNVSRNDRKTYIQMAKTNKYSVFGYYFESKLRVCQERNSCRHGKEQVSYAGMMSKYAGLELPCFDEGFEQLKYVFIKDQEFIVNNWKDEV